MSGRIRRLTLRCREAACTCGALRRNFPVSSAARRPPAGVELVLEVDDVTAERGRVVAAGWPVEEDLQLRSWRLTDFRILDPAGYYLRITGRARQ